MGKSDILIGARQPEELAKIFLERANQGDVEGLVALYEPQAVLGLPDGRIARGSEDNRKFYSALLASRPHFDPGTQRLPLRSGDLALTSSVLVNGTVTAEIARQQADESWLWVVDQPAIVVDQSIN
jgi:ketosteroid isomerase-like protein